MFVVFLALVVGSQVFATDTIHPHGDLVKDEPFASPHRFRSSHHAAAALHRVPHRKQFHPQSETPSRTKYEYSLVGGVSDRHRHPKSMLRSLTSEFGVTKPLSKYGRKEPSTFDGNYEKVKVNDENDGRRAHLESGSASESPPSRRSRRQAMFVINAADDADFGSYDDSSNVDANAGDVEQEYAAQLSPSPQNGALKLATVEPERKAKDASPRRVPAKPDEQSASLVAADDGFREPTNEERIRAPSGATIERQEADELKARLSPLSNLLLGSHDEPSPSPSQFAAGKDENSSNTSEASASVEPQDLEEEEDGANETSDKTAAPTNDESSEAEMTSSEEEVVSAIVQELMRQRGQVYEYDREKKMPPKSEIQLIDEICGRVEVLIGEVSSRETTGSYEEFQNIASFLTQLRRYRRKLQTRKENLIRQLQTNVVSSDDIIEDFILKKVRRQPSKVTLQDRLKLLEEMWNYASDVMRELVSGARVSSYEASDDRLSYLAEMVTFRHKVLIREQKLLGELRARTSNERTTPATATAEIDFATNQSPFFLELMRARTQEPSAEIPGTSTSNEDQSSSDSSDEYSGDNDWNSHELAFEVKTKNTEKTIDVSVDESTTNFVDIAENEDDDDQDVVYPVNDDVEVGRGDGSSFHGRRNDDDNTERAPSFKERIFNMQFVRD